MCGLCGYISEIEYQSSVIKNMTGLLEHRGPDDEGELSDKFSERHYIGLGHRRLSIIDLSALGHQPMQSYDDSIVLIYNGEVYNFLDIRMKLEKRGYVFRSNTDTEVLIYAYKEYGMDFFDKLNGMFAIALWDKNTGDLILARDRMGKKPLYYYFDGKEVVFASELKSIMAYPGFRKEIRTELISSFLTNKSIAAPDTIFKNTFKLETGQYVIISEKNGILEIQKDYYWKLIEKYKEGQEESIEDYDTAKSQLRKTLLKAVERRLISDVPIGSFLSGGIDSSIITALMKECVEGEVKTYSIGFNEKNVDESGYARAVADYLGTKHTEYYVSEKDLLKEIDNMPYIYDEPFSDSSQIPSTILCRLAKKDVTVALSGDGGDELFCGYNIYDWVNKIKKYDKISGIAYSTFYRPFIMGTKIDDIIPKSARALLNNRDVNVKLQCFNDVLEIYTNKLIVDCSESSKYRGFETELNFVLGQDYDWQIKRMLLDMKYYMPEEVLVKMDRASMASSLEVRCPILDREVVELSFRVPHRFKYHKKDKKHILKEILYDIVPRDLVDRPKMGFGVPLGKWITGELSDEILRFSEEDKLKRQGIFDPSELAIIIELNKKRNKGAYATILWGYLMFQKWYDYWIENF